MTATNPYSAPQVDVDVPGTEPIRIASPLSRLGAAIVDGLVFVPGYVLLALAGVMTESGRLTERGLVPGLIGFLALLLPLVVTCYFVATRAQTIGKRALGIYVARRDGQRAGFWRIVLLRNLLLILIQWAFWLVGFTVLLAGGNREPLEASPVAAAVMLVPALLAMIDILMIVSRDHRTLHDRLGGTVVARER